MSDDNLTAGQRLPEVMPLAAAAEALGVATPTLKHAIDRGDLRAAPIVGQGTGQRSRWVVTRDDLLDFLDRMAERAAQPRAPRRAPDVEAAVIAHPAPRRRRHRPATMDLPIPSNHRRAA